MDPRDVTVVLQGTAPADDGALAQLQDRLRRLRAALPGAPVVYSTWQGAPWPAGIAVDQAVFSPDPGELVAYKLGPCKSNNVNRQIVSSAAGLALVSTPYAIKLRCDATLEHAGALDWLGRLHARLPGQGGRIVTVGPFSIDPRSFEQMPLHLSDWFQFGPTARLRALWSAPPMTPEDANHYAWTPYAAHSTLFDRRFLARFPAEQHVWRAFAKTLGYAVPDFHNDNRPAVLEAHDRFLATEVAMLDLPQAGLCLPKMAWVARSGMQRFNCLNHLDWLALAAREQAWPLSPAQQQAVARRQQVRAAVRRSFRAAGPLLPALVVPPLKPVLSRVLKCADAWSRQRAQPLDFPNAPALQPQHP